MPSKFDTFKGPQISLKSLESVNALGEALQSLGAAFGKSNLPEFEVKLSALVEAAKAQQLEKDYGVTPDGPVIEICGDGMAMARHVEPPEGVRWVHENLGVFNDQMTKTVMIICPSCKGLWKFPTGWFEDDPPPDSLIFDTPSAKAQWVAQRMIEKKTPNGLPPAYFDTEE